MPRSVPRDSRQSGCRLSSDSATLVECTSHNQSSDRSFTKSCLRVVVFAFVMVAMTSGCRPDGAGVETGEVSGKVIWQSKPVANARISFNNPEKGVGATGTLDAAGNFQISEPLPIGTYIVSILPPAAPPPLSPEAKQPRPAWTIPEKYGSETTSDLQVDVHHGKNDKTLELSE